MNQIEGNSPLSLGELGASQLLALAFNLLSCSDEKEKNLVPADGSVFLLGQSGVYGGQEGHCRGVKTQQVPVKQKELHF